MKAVLVTFAVLACANAMPGHRSDQDFGFGLFANPLFPFDDTSISSESEDSSDSFPIFAPIIPFRFFRPIIPNIKFPNPDKDSNLKVVNSTSETKVINGHKVMINETYYENPKTGAVLHSVRINGYTPDTIEPAGKDNKPDDVVTTTPALIPEGKSEKRNEVEPLRDPEADEDVLNA